MLIAMVQPASFSVLLALCPPFYLLLCLPFSPIACGSGTNLRVNLSYC